MSNPRIPENPPAFARSGFAPEGVRSEDCDITDQQEGMSLRDYFAAFALGGLRSGESKLTSPEVAERAYELADLMLAERVKVPNVFEQLEQTADKLSSVWIHLDAYARGEPFTPEMAVSILRHQQAPGWKEEPC